MTLASLAPRSENPAIALPGTKSLADKSRVFSAKKKRSFSPELLARSLELAPANGKTGVSWSRSKSFGAVDLEALRAITRLDEVKRRIDSWQFGKRCVYIISGLRAAVDSFTVTDKKASEASGSVDGSGPVPAGGMMPLEVGGGSSGASGDKSSRSY